MNIKYVAILLFSLCWYTGTCLGQASCVYVTINKEKPDTINIYDPYAINDKVLHGVASTDCSALNDNITPYYLTMDYFMKQHTYLSHNVYYPEDAKRKNIHGLVIVHFKVDSTGRVAQPSIFKPLFPSIDTQVLRVIKTTPPKKVHPIFKNIAYRTILKF